MKLSVKFILLALPLITVGCGSAQRDVRENVIDPGPVVTAAPLPHSQRMTVGIARFSNETHYGSGLFLDEHGDRIGKQASDSLARHLMQTQRFTVVERQDVGRLEDEAHLMGRSDKEFRSGLKGVDALIVGSVVELGRETTGKGWLVGRSKDQRARARVVLRMVDPENGELFYSAEGSGEATLSTTSTLGFGGQASYDSTLVGKAIDAAIVNMMNNVVATLDARATVRVGGGR